MEDVLNIPGSIHSISQEGNAVYANEVFDKRKNKKQQLVNQETDEELANHGQRIGTMEEAVGEGGSVDERIAQAKSEAESDIKGGASEDYDTLKKAEEAIKAEVNAREGAVSDEASARQDAINTAKTEIIGGASADCNTLGKAEIKISTNAQDIAQLQAAYEALTQSTPVIVEPTDTWPVASPEEGVIYRVIDRVNTPPQNYSDYMYNGTAMVLMATYDNAIDDIPTPGSNNLVKSGGVASHIVYDISEANAVGSTLATYDDLAAALGNNGANIPPSIRKGGMQVKFIQGSVGSSDNKYAQYRYMGTATTGSPNPFLDTANWQGVDGEPTAGSDNLVKSSGVVAYVGLIIVDIESINSVTTPYVSGLACEVNLKAGDYFTVKIEGTGTLGNLSIRSKVNGSLSNILLNQGTFVLNEEYILQANRDIDEIYYYSTSETNLSDVVITINTSVSYEIIRRANKVLQDVGQFRSSIYSTSNANLYKAIGDLSIPTSHKLKLRFVGNITGRVIITCNTTNAVDYVEANKWYDYTTVEQVTQIGFRAMGSDSSAEGFVEVNDNFVLALSELTKNYQELDTDLQETKNKLNVLQETVGSETTQKTLNTQVYLEVFDGLSIKAGEQFSISVMSPVKYWSRIILAANGAGDAADYRIVDKVETQNTKSGYWENLIAEVDITSIYCYITVVNGSEATNVEFSLFTNLCEDAINAKTRDKDIRDCIGYAKSDLLYTTTPGYDYMVQGLSYPAGKKIKVRLVGTSDAGRLMIFANGRRYADTGAVLIRDNAAVNTWYEFTPSVQVTSFGLWFANEWAGDNKKLSVYLEVKDESANSELLSNINELKENINSYVPDFIANDVLTIDNVDFVRGDNISHYSVPKFFDSLTPLYSLPKRGFMCLRSDDSTPNAEPGVTTGRWPVARKVMQIAEYFGFRYTISVNIAASWSNEQQRKEFREAQVKGHELADHTPNNNTRYVEIRKAWESIFTPYVGSGISEIVDSSNADRKALALMFESNVDYLNTQYGTAGAYHTVAGSNTITGDFTVTDDNPDHAGIAAMTIAANEFGGKMLYAYIDTANGDVPTGWCCVKTKNNDSITICDILGNPLNFETSEDITMYLCIQRSNNRVGNFELTEDATYVLLLAGQMWFEYYGLQRPKTWVQVGGPHPWAKGNYLTTALKALGMYWAECITGGTTLTYNYADGVANPQASTWWEGGVLHFDEVNESVLPDVKALIANRIATKRTSSFATHHIFPNFTGNTDAEKEQSYLKFMYDVFKFCADNNFMLVTMSERKRLLIDCICDEKVNIIPEIWKDATNSGTPDGFDSSSLMQGCSFVSTGGKIESRGHAIYFSGTGTDNESSIVMKIPSLGAVSKGKNVFKFDVKGACGILDIKIHDVTGTPTLLAQQNYDQAENNVWKPAEFEFDVPVTCNFIGITIYLNGTSDGTYITNLELKKK